MSVLNVAFDPEGAPRFPAYKNGCLWLNTKTGKLEVGSVFGDMGVTSR